MCACVQHQPPEKPGEAQPKGLHIRAARMLIRAYQLTLSSLIGRNCRYLPTCSEYTSDAIGRFGLWAGMWVGIARIARCHPWGQDGFDPIPETLDTHARWYTPWRYGVWRMPNDNQAKAEEAQ